MNKADLITAISKNTGYTKKDVSTVVEAFTDVVTEALAQGQDVNISGFGKFLTRKRAARTARNLQTGETIQVPSRVSPAFKAGAKLKEAVRNS